MLSVRSLLPSSHVMLVIGVYHPPKVNYMESTLVDAITSVTDDFLDSVPDGAIVCGGDLNRLNTDHLCTVAVLTVLVDFPTRGDATLDNCLTNKPGLFQTPYPYKNLIKTDHIMLTIFNLMKTNSPWDWATGSEHIGSAGVNIPITGMGSTVREESTLLEIPQDHSTMFPPNKCDSIVAVLL
ncbi:hypothetical protein AC249_AIPGENE1924, partial [Exaiptasia diaphana]